MELNLQISILICIEIQLQLLEISPSNLKHAHFQRWRNSVLAAIKATLADKEIPQLDKVVTLEKPALKSFQEAMLFDLTSTKFKDQSELAHKAILILLEICLNDDDIGYDGRLRTTLLLTVKKIIGTDSNPLLILFMAESAYLTGISNKIEGISDPDLKKDDGTNLLKYSGIALASITGGVIIGLSGGLALPVIASGLGALTGTTGFAALTSATSVAIVGTMLGSAGAGLAGYKLNRRLKDLEEFYFANVSNSEPRMSYYIVISGWLTDPENITEHWDHITDWNPLIEVTALIYDPKALHDLTTAADEFIKTNLISSGVYGAALMTSAASLAFALSLPVSLIQAASMLDNPWNMALTKSEQAGIHLARSVLDAHVGGKRPVTLVGHGMGARTIIYCLLELNELKKAGKDIYGLVDRVYLMGTCASLNQEQWSDIRDIVSGRFVNCYSQNDWFLKILFRLHINGPIGAGPVDCDGVENIDASEIITSHGEYCTKLDEILVACNFEKE